LHIVGNTVIKTTKTTQSNITKKTNSFVFGRHVAMLPAM